MFAERQCRANLAVASRNGQRVRHPHRPITRASAGPQHEYTKEPEVPEPNRRARNMAELHAVLSAFAATPQQAARARPYRPRPTDVIISPYAKCGTTLLQQMFHQLRMGDSGGDMEFDDISRVVPWIETAASLDVDINADQRTALRGFKSHLPYEALPPGARYVVGLRDPVDAFASFYRFMEGWLFEPGTIAMDEFFSVWLRESPDRSDYFTHLLSWWARRDQSDTLVMTYAHIVKQKRAEIRRVAAFIGADLTQETLALTERRTSRAFMLEHKSAFADPMMRRLSEERANLPPGGDPAKIRAAGDTDQGRTKSCSRADRYAVAGTDRTCHRSRKFCGTGGRAGMLAPAPAASAPRFGQPFRYQNCAERAPAPRRNPQFAAIAVLILRSVIGIEFERERCLIEQHDQPLCRALTKLFLIRTTRAGDFRCVDIGKANLNAAMPQRIAIDHAIYPCAEPATGKPSRDERAWLYNRPYVRCGGSLGRSAPEHYRSEQRQRQRPQNRAKPPRSLPESGTLFAAKARSTEGQVGNALRHRPSLPRTGHRKINSHCATRALSPFAATS